MTFEIRQRFDSVGPSESYDVTVWTSERVPCASHDHGPDHVSGLLRCFIVGRRVGRDEFILEMTKLSSKRHASNVLDELHDLQGRAGQKVVQL